MSNRIMSADLVAYCVACGQPLPDAVAESHMTPDCLERYFRILAVRAADTARANVAKYTVLAEGIAAGRLAEERQKAELAADLEPVLSAGVTADLAEDSDAMAAGIRWQIENGVTPRDRENQ